MQSDTVIGIVGAVVLVSVMFGVFLYEFNNTDEPEVQEPTAAEIEAEKRANFNATFMGFNPDGDLDGDGVPNYNDTDMDDDGLDDFNGTELVDRDFMQIHDAGGVVSAGVTGGQGPTASSGFSHTFTAEEGLGHVMLSLSHSEANANAGDFNPSLEVTIRLPNGDPTTLSPTRNGGMFTYNFEDTVFLLPGDYTITVALANNAIIGGGTPSDITVSGDLTFHYMVAGSMEMEA